MSRVLMCVCVSLGCAVDALCSLKLGSRACLPSAYSMPTIEQSTKSVPAPLTKRGLFSSCKDMWASNGIFAKSLVRDSEGEASIAKSQHALPAVFLCAARIR